MHLENNQKTKKDDSFEDDAPSGSDSENEPVVNRLINDTDNADDETSDTEYEDDLPYNVEAFINPVYDVDDLDLDDENTDDESINREEDPFVGDGRNHDHSNSQEDHQELEEPNNTEPESLNTRNENSNNGQPGPSIDPGDGDHNNARPGLSRRNEDSNNAQPGTSRNIEHHNFDYAQQSVSNNSMDPNNAQQDTYNNPVNEDANYENGILSSTINQDSNYTQQSVSRNSNNDFNKAIQDTLSNSHNEDSINGRQDAPSNQMISKVSILYKKNKTWLRSNSKELVSGPIEVSRNRTLDSSYSFASYSNGCRSPQSVDDENNARSQTPLPSNNYDQSNASNITSPPPYGTYGTPGRHYPTTTQHCSSSWFRHYETRQLTSNFPSGTPTYDDSPLPYLEVLHTLDDATLQLLIYHRASRNPSYQPPHLTNYSASHNGYGLWLPRNGMTRPSVHSLSSGYINEHRYRAPDSNNYNARTLPSSGYPVPVVSSPGALGAFGNLDSSLPGYAVPDLPWCVFHIISYNGNFSGSTALNNYNCGRHADQETFQYSAPNFSSYRAQGILIYFPTGSNGFLNYREPFNFLIFPSHAIPARSLNLNGYIANSTGHLASSISYYRCRNLSDRLIRICPIYGSPSNTNRVSGNEFDSHTIFDTTGTPVTSYDRDQTSRFVISRERYTFRLYPDATLMDEPISIPEFSPELGFSVEYRCGQASSSSGPTTHSESGTSVTSYDEDQTLSRFVISRERYTGEGAYRLCPDATLLDEPISIPEFPTELGFSNEHRCGQGSSSSGPTTQESGTPVTRYNGDQILSRFVISREQYIPAITLSLDATLLDEPTNIPELPPDVGISDEQRWGQASSSSDPTTQSESLNVPSLRARGRGRGRGRGRYLSRGHNRCNVRGHSQNHGNRHDN